MAWRRTLLISAGATLLGGGWAWAAFFRTGEYRLGQARLMPPLLRTRVGGQDRLFALVRRRETEILPALSLRDADGGERLALRAWNPETLEPLFEAPLLPVAAGEYGDGGILGEQSATIWIHAGGLGAASAVDGRMLADAPGIQARNAMPSPGLPDARAAYRFGNGLEFTDALRATYRLDPRTFRLSSAREAPPAGLPAPQPPAPWFPNGAPGLADARPEGIWMGLLPAALTSGDARFAALSGGPSKLWRATAATAGAAAGPGKPPAPAAAMPTQAVPVEDGPLFGAQLLALGTEALTVGAPPGVLLLYRPAQDGPLRLARIGTDGIIAWRATLPLQRVSSLLPGSPALVLAGRRAGADRNAGPEAIVSINLGTGAVLACDIATGEAISA